MTKGKIKFYKYDNDLITCDCSACDEIRLSFVDKKTHKELSCHERLVNFLRKIIFK